ncbi:MAG TPA: TonB-dependent receptor [Cyclobacteriaceae bacterium]
MSRTALILTLLAATVGTTLAQTVDSLKTYTSPEIVITAQYEPQSVDKSVYRIRTIPMERIQARGAVRLQDVLNTELNIRFSQDLATGTSNMTMQGLAGQNVKVLIDGMPMVGRQSTDNSFNINQINVNSIERIEIIEGPMSVIYGADALAGVINIITKKTPDGKLDLTVRVHEESVGKEYGVDKGIHNESAGVAFAKNTFNARADFARNYFGGFKGDSTGREEMWHPKTQYLGNALVGFNTERSRAYYRVDYLNENIFNPGKYGQGGAQKGVALDQNYITNRLMHQLQGAHTFSDKLSFNGALAYTHYTRKTQTTTVNEQTGDVRLSLGPGQQDLTTFDGATFRGTFQYKVRDKFILQPGLDLNHETGEGGRIQPGAHAIGDYAFFLSGEWTMNSRVQFRPGIRITYNTAYDAPPVMPSLNTKIKLTERQDLRLSYGRGFRAPSIRELYFDFFDASHSIEGNPGLKPETSNSFNGSWNWSWLQVPGNKVTMAVGGFFNNVGDMVNYGVKAGSTVTTYINVDRYKTKGLTWNNGWRNNNWDVNLGFAYTGRYNQLRADSNGSPAFQWSPEINTNASYKTTKGGWTFSFYYKYTGKLPYPEIVNVNNAPVVNIAKMSAYHWADASVQKQVSKNFSATAGLRNLFNITNVNTTSLAGAGAHTQGPVRPIGSGRAYYLSLIYTFNQ